MMTRDMSILKRYSTVWLFLMLLSLVGGVGAQTSVATAAPAAEQAEPPGHSAGASLTTLPLYFIENQGQVDKRVAFYLQGRDKSVYFTRDGLTFVLTKDEG